MDNQSEWLFLANELLSPVLPQTSFDAFFVHGWADLHDEMIEFVGVAYKKYKPRLVLINGEKEYEPGKPGVEYWKTELEKRGIPRDAIRGAIPGLHTLYEAKSFCAIGAAEKLSKILVISVPQHVIRAFLTNVGWALHEKLPFRFAGRSMAGVEWNEPISVEGLMNNHEETTRVGRLVSECGRIVKYRSLYEAGDDNCAIASFNEGADHIRNFSK